jgi:hypothetical protein
MRRKLNLSGVGQEYGGQFGVPTALAVAQSGKKNCYAPGLTWSSHQPIRSLSLPTPTMRYCSVILVLTFKQAIRTVLTPPMTPKTGQIPAGLTLGPQKFTPGSVATRRVHTVT